MKSVETITTIVSRVSSIVSVASEGSDDQVAPSMSRAIHLTTLFAHLQLLTREKAVQEVSDEAEMSFPGWWFVERENPMTLPNLNRKLGPKDSGVELHVYRPATRLDKA